MTISSTPAKDIPTKDLDFNTEALADCLDQLSFVPKTVLDIRYGLGGWAKETTSKYPKAKLYGLEPDTKTLKKAFRSSMTTVIQGKFPEDIPKQWPKKFDLIIADFNDLTLFKKEPLDELLSLYTPLGLIFTDICSSKIHLNYQSYGLKKKVTWRNLRPYYQKFRLEGYKFIFHSCRHYYASTALFQRKKP